MTSDDFEREKRLRELEEENARLRKAVEYAAGEDNLIPRMHSDAKKEVLEILTPEQPHDR